MGAVNNYTTPTASNLAAGTYTVTITDTQTGCNASDDVVITEPAVLIHVINTYDASCFSVCDGAADINAIGGTLPYNYQWQDNGGNPLAQTTDSIIGLCAGDYTVTLSDANGCTIFDQITINEPVQVVISVTGLDASCFGVCDGSANVTNLSGVAPYQYQWDANAGNQTTQTATGLCAGTYSVTVTDANGCSATSSVTINEPTLLTTVIDLTGDVSCAGFCDGFAQITSGGGTTPYSILWDNGSVNAVNNNLCAGNYSVTVTDANGCTATQNTTINQPQSLTATTTSADATCYNSCNGTAGVTINGGTAPISIQWDDPAFSTTANISNLCAGSYNVNITDANGCFLTEAVTINQPSILDFTVTKQDANCGQFNGYICANVVGGVPPYFYSWNDPNSQLTACAFNLHAGCYIGTITDGNGCTKDSLICINDIAGPTVTVNNYNDVTCFGSMDGAIDVTASGGVGTLTIQWIDGSGNPITSLNNLNTTNTLNGDTYGIIVTDTANCVATATQFIFEPTVVNSAITASVDPSCFGGCNGTATVSASGGVGSYTYQWIGGAAPTSNVNSGLCANTPYDVTVTDANGCTHQSTVTLNEPTQLIVNTTLAQNISCFNACDGEITVSATGATPPYSYGWTNNISNGTQATNVCPGTYTTTITDAQGCVAALDNTITEPALLAVQAALTDATCSQCNGEAALTVTGGSTPYVYSWGSGSAPNAANNTGLCPGAVNVDVTDAHGCIASLNLTINDQAGPAITGMTFTSPLCYGLSNGTATVLTNGGTGTIQYQWNDPAQQNTSTAFALIAGNYCVTVNDQNACQATNCITVSQPNPLVAVGDLDVTICYGDSAQVWASGQGGTAPYTINWITSGMSGSGPITVQPSTSSTYCFTVTDANGCLSPNDCVDITVNPQLDIDLTPATAICSGDSIVLNAQATGGNGGPYNFAWTDSAGNTLNGTNVGNNSSVTVNPGTTTWYYVTLDDGCSLNTMDSVQITVNANPLIFLNVVDSAGCAPFTAQFIMNSDIGTTFTYDFECDGVIDYTGTAANATHTYPNPGTYDVCVTTTSADGCTSSLSAPGMITVYPVPTANFLTTPETTTILSPTITFTDQSAGNPVTYAWDFGDGNSLAGAPGGVVPPGTNNDFTTGTFDNPVHMYSDTGTFTVTLTITNQFGCTDQVSYTVTIEGDYILFTPNSFTPNGDGKNDIFYPMGIGIAETDYHLWIFNRWGQLIFESYNASTGWDGTYKNQLSKQDVYVWKVQAKDYKGDIHDYIGHVTLLR